MTYRWQVGRIDMTPESILLNDSCVSVLRRPVGEKKSSVYWPSSLSIFWKGLICLLDLYSIESYIYIAITIKTYVVNYLEITITPLLSRS